MGENEWGVLEYLYLGMFESMKILQSCDMLAKKLLGGSRDA